MPERIGSPECKAAGFLVPSSTRLFHATSMPGFGSIERESAGKHVWPPLKSEFRYRRAVDSLLPDSTRRAGSEIDGE